MSLRGEEAEKRRIEEEMKVQNLFQDVDKWHKNQRIRACLDAVKENLLKSLDR